MVMNVLKALLILVRWGNNLTDQDIYLANEMTFMEVFHSSYLTSHTIYTKYNNQIKRR